MNRQKAAATAYHEAGHAVAQHFLRLPIKRVSIRPADQSSGRVESIRYNKPMDLAYLLATQEIRLHHEVIARLAGEIAQRRFNARSVRKGHAKQDHASAKDVIVKLTMDSDVATALYRYLETRAQALIAAKWAHVEKVAAALLEREELNGREVSAIIIQTTREESKQMRASK